MLPPTQVLQHDPRIQPHRIVPAEGVGPGSGRFRYYLLLRNSPDTNRAEWGIEAKIRLQEGYLKPLRGVGWPLTRANPYYGSIVR